MKMNSKAWEESCMLPSPHHKKKKWKGVIGHFVNLDPRPQNSIDTAKVKDNILKKSGADNNSMA